MKNSIILLGVHRWQHEYVIDQAIEIYDKIVVLIPNSEKIKHDHLNEKVSTIYYNLVLSNEEFDSLLSEINHFVSGKWNVLAFDDYSTVLASRLSCYAEVFLYPEKATETCSRKHRLRELWNKVAIKSEFVETVRHSLVETIGLTNSQEIKVMSGVKPSNLSFPVIVKPNYLDGSYGVSRARTFDDLKDKLNDTIEKLYATKSFLETLGVKMVPEVLIEEDISSGRENSDIKEFNLNLLSINGKHKLIAATDKISDARYFIETAYILPSKVSDNMSLLNALIKSVSIILEQLEVQNGFSNWDFMFNKNEQPVLVEGQLRPSGDYFFKRFKLHYNYNPFQLLNDANFVPTSEMNNRGFTFTIKLFPSESMWKVKDIDYEKDDHIQVIIDELLFQCYDWQGPVRGSSAYVVLLGNCKRRKDILPLVNNFVSKIRIIGEDRSREKIEGNFALINRL